MASSVGRVSTRILTSNTGMWGTPSLDRTGAGISVCCLSYRTSVRKTLVTPRGGILPRFALIGGLMRRYGRDKIDFCSHNPPSTPISLLDESIPVFPKQMGPRITFVQVVERPSTYILFSFF